MERDRFRRSQSGPAVLTLVGEGGVTRALTLDELSALPQAELISTGRDSSRITLRGPTLRSLLDLVGAPAGHALRGPGLLVVVVAEAADGYKVAYTLAELDGQFSTGIAIAAISQNGDSLSAEEGPIRIALSGSTQHRARWLRQLTTLRLVRIGT